MAMARFSLTFDWPAKSASLLRAERGLELPLVFAAATRKQCPASRMKFQCTSVRRHACRYHQLQRPAEQRVEIVRFVRRSRLRRPPPRPPRAPTPKFISAEITSSSVVLKALLAAGAPRRARCPAAGPACRATPAPCAPRSSCRRRESAPVARRDPGRGSPRQIRRGQPAQRRHGQLRPDAAHRDQFFEQRLVGGRYESEQQQGVFPHVRMDVQLNLGCLCPAATSRPTPGSSLRSRRRCTSTITRFGCFSRSVPRRWAIIKARIQESGRSMRRQVFCGPGAQRQAPRSRATMPVT